MDAERAVAWLSENMALAIGLPIALIFMLWGLKALLKARMRTERDFSSTASLLSLTENASLTPDERERVKKKLREQLKRDMENKPPAPDQH